MTLRLDQAWQDSARRCRRQARHAPRDSPGLQAVTNRPANHFPGHHSLLFRLMLDRFSQLRLDTNWERLRRGSYKAAQAVAAALTDRGRLRPRLPYVQPHRG
jgi:hypothetical protein